MQQSRKCASLAAIFLFTPYKTTWITAVSNYCLAKLPATDACGQHQQPYAAKRLSPTAVTWSEPLLPWHCYSIKANFTSIHTQVSKPVSAGNVAELVNCMLIVASPSPGFRNRGTKDQKEGVHFLIQYWMYAVTEKLNIEWGAQI